MYERECANRCRWLTAKKASISTWTIVWLRSRWDSSSAICNRRKRHQDVDLEDVFWGVQDGQQTTQLSLWVELSQLQEIRGSFEHTHINSCNSLISLLKNPSNALGQVFVFPFFILGDLGDLKAENGVYLILTPTQINLPHKIWIPWTPPQ